MKPPSFLWSPARARKRLFEIGPERAWVLKADMQADQPLADLEIGQRIIGGRLPQARHRRHDEALMPAPADADAEEPQRIDEGGDCDRLVHLEGEEACHAEERR